MDETTSLGPLSTEAVLLKLLEQVKRAVAGGATIVMGGKRVDRPGLVYDGWLYQKATWNRS